MDCLYCVVGRQGAGEGVERVKRWQEVRHRTIKIAFSSHKFDKHLKCLTCRIVIVYYVFATLKQQLESIT